MDHNDFSLSLNRHTLPSVLLFEGEEEHLKQDALFALRKALLPEGMEEMNELVLDDPSADELIAASYLSSVPVSTLLLFYCTGKPDGRKKIYTTVKKMGGIVTFSSLKGVELTRFVTDAFRRLDKQCNDRTAEYMIFTVGSDTGTLQSEISKIASFASDRSDITPADISAIATPSMECTVFQMVDAVVAGQNSRALTLLRNQLLAGTDRMAVLSMLLRQYRLLQHIKIMQYEKKSKDYIRAALGVPPFAVEQYLRQASSYTGGQVKRAVSACFGTEYAVKSGRMQAEKIEITVIL